MVSHSGRSIITLGGLDEKPLWAALETSDQSGRTSGRPLVYTAIGAVDSQNLERPLHMATVDLGWNSRNDVETYLRQDVETSRDESWKGDNRIVKWCIRGCISLPDFVATGCTTIQLFEDGDDDVDRMIQSLSLCVLDVRLLM